MMIFEFPSRRAYQETGHDVVAIVRYMVTGSLQGK